MRLNRRRCAAPFVITCFSFRDNIRRLPRATTTIWRSPTLYATACSSAACNRSIYRENAELRGVMDLIGSGALSQSDPNLLRHLVDGLLSHDWFMLLADYQSYVECQSQVSELWHVPKSWARKSIINVARMRKFSSYRSIREYCDRVWQVNPLSSQHSIAS
jgi:glucan phosphorylase